jgi:hypothetical protein
MVETLGPETLRNLKVRAGEHLAALLTTAFLFTPPMRVDTDGGADLCFVRQINLDELGGRTVIVQPDRVRIRRPD